MPLREFFDRAAFDIGLQQLSVAVSASPILSPFCPLELVTSGGFVSVVYLGNRSACRDLDYFFDPKQLKDQYEKVREELQVLIKAVGEDLQYVANWVKDDVSLFVQLLHKPATLFEDSKQQGLTMWRDPNLIIHAVKWEWVLARKLKRLQMEGREPRTEDWTDCVAISKHLYDIKGRMLSPSILQMYDNVERESPVLPGTIAGLVCLVQQVHQVNAFPSAAWVYLAADEPLVYRWSDGSPIARDTWPARRGTIVVYIPVRQPWRYYDFDANSWGEFVNPTETRLMT